MDPGTLKLALYFLLYVDDTVTEPSEGSDQTTEVATEGGESTEGSVTQDNNSEATGTFDLGYSFKPS